ncbi:hypothetical protein A33I_14170 [Alkalihalophilus marmarensis DSM 21297]|uniref:Uncharacterized protein n=1 Tax=Alkalihalophilus marmarensis DSM 21297 TaxID=1188261 RepID=U6SQD4_9BACI|nr:hypothetical protein A33I_14170 [Alkalihalophilus marmarensis DSM 21297]
MLSIKVNIKLKRWFIFLLKASSWTGNHRMYSWTFHTFFQRGSVITIGGK